MFSARFQDFDRVVRAGSVTTTRGCKHLCTHCPVAALYDGRFYAIDIEAVMTDISDLVDRGVSHISFSDPDFLNGPTHALRVTRRMHSQYPELSFDYTAKIEHLLAHPKAVREMRDLGSAFVVSAVESLDEEFVGSLPPPPQ